MSRTRSVGRSLLSGAAAALVAVSLTAPAHADPSPSPAATATDGTTAPDGLSSVDLSQQIAEANRLWAKINASNAELGTALKELQKLADRTNKVLQQLDEARTAQARANARVKRTRAELVEVRKRLARLQQAMRAWAEAAYAEGSANPEVANMLDLMSNPGDAAGDPLGDLSYLADDRARAVLEIAALEKRSSALAVSAAAEARKATAATTRVAAQKKALDGLVKERETKVAALKDNQAAAIREAGPVAGLLVWSQDPDARRAAQRLRDALAANGVTDIPAAATCSDDERPYPNGMLPGSALCPLYKAAGEVARPRAAASFNALSRQYEKETGSPLCVTDSYRSLAQQYAVKASRGFWAATPGTSQHGFGVALDLCGGIQSFGSPAYMWMKQNGPLYGWYHPDWAEPGGRKPEPWHWQFAG